MCVEHNCLEMCLSSYAHIPCASTYHMVSGVQLRQWKNCLKEAEISLPVKCTQIPILPNLFYHGIEPSRGT
jgi:hypothetical protein